MGDEQIDFTWSKHPAPLSNPLDFNDPDTFRGIVPVLEFDDFDEIADTPDVAFWNIDNSGDAGLSIGV